jgi:hypothetical protein
VYQALLDRECELNERDDRLAAAQRAAHGRCTRRDRWLGVVLEAGEPVTLSRVSVELALWQRDRPAGRVRLPFDKEVRHVEIAADDSVAAAADPWGDD